MIGIIALILRILLAAALYAFLVFAIVTIWRDLRHQTSGISSLEVPPIKLIPLSGEMQEFLSGNRNQFIIGRARDCELIVSDPSVSSRHANIAYHHKQWWLKDLGSKNGTLLNDEKISSPTVLLSGDQVGCGSLKWTIEIQQDQISLEKKAGDQND